jgi:hypothetical protein
MFTNILKTGNKHHKVFVLEELDTPEGLGGGNPTEGFEFLLVSFKDLVTVTNNFHTSFFIGKGGFGMVYKVNPILLLFS